MEMTVVVAAVAMFVALGLPAIHALINSFQTEAGTRAMIGAALSSARALAAKEQRYAGIRFQKAYQPTDPLKAPQYMVFIVHEEPRKMGNLTIGFRAADGLEPIKLPDTVGVMDFRINGIDQVNSDATIQNDDYVIDTSAFSIIFSPSGKMVIHEVRVRNRDGKTTGTETATVSMDDIFNTLSKVTDPVNPTGMFVQDDAYPKFPGLAQEPSRNSFVIYDRVKFKDAYKSGRAWSDYLHTLERIYINPYTGTIINR